MARLARLIAGYPYSPSEYAAAEKVLRWGIPVLVFAGACLPSFLRARDFLARAPLTDSLAYVDKLGQPFWGIAFAVVFASVLAGQVCVMVDRHRLLFSIFAHGAAAIVYLVYVIVLVQGAFNIGWSNGWKAPAGALAGLSLHVVLFFLRIALKGAHDGERRLALVLERPRQGDDPGRR